MKKITLLLFVLCCFATASAQYVFSPIAGPTNVASGTPVTIELNDVANSAGVTPSSTGSYNRFTVTVDWVAGGGNPWSAEADLTFTTTAGSLTIDPPTDGGGFNGDATTLTFEGELAGVYDPTVDGFIELVFNQSFGGSDADWSNIVVTLLESPTCITPSGMSTGAVTSTTAELNWIAGDSETDWDIEYNSVDDFTPGNGEEEASLNITGSPTASLSGLTAVTTYFVYYRANCGGSDGSSEWAGPFTFETLCDVFTPNYVEDFAELVGFAQIIPDCWEEADAGDVTTGPQNLGTSSWVADEFNNTGTGDGAYKINLWLASKSDWIISPQFDLTGGPFQVDFDFAIAPFGQSTAGTLGSDDFVQLLITTDNGATWTVLQTFDSNSTVPAGGTQVVEDLTAYAGQIVQFGILGSEGTVDDPEDNDVFVDNFRVREIPNCPEPNDVIVSNITESTADISWSSSVPPATAWEYVVSPAGTGEPTGPGTEVTETNVSIDNLDPDTDYEFWVRAICGSDSSIWVGPVNFSTTLLLNFTVDCDAGPVNTNFCYFNDIDDDPSVATFTYTSSNGLPLNLTFNQGQLEGCCDELVVIDSDGTELFNDNLTDVSGLTFQSSGDTISWYINSDFSVSCESSGFTPFDVTVACATCINPQASYQIVSDCENADQFFIDVNVTSIGDATSLTISNDFDANTIAVTETGVYQTGPFPFLTDIVITVSNDQDNNCVINSDAFQLSACPPENDNPCQATVVGVNEDNSCTIFETGTVLEATDSGIGIGSCDGDDDDDVWFQFTATNEFHIIQLNNIQNEIGFGGLVHGVYSGTCDNLTEVYCSDNEGSLASGLTAGETYYIRVFSDTSAPETITFEVCIKPGFNNITVDQTSFTVDELVTDVLIGLDCAEISNITSSTGSDFGEENGIAYFTAEEGSFPFTEGVVMTTGNALEAEGPNEAGVISSGSTAWPGDDELEAIVADGPTNNASIIEFDFVAYADNISFDFFMASEEYGSDFFECNFSDAFAFLLTDENDITTNLAVIPGTNDPIFVTNVHLENSVCPAVNEEFFGEYIPEGLPPMAFNGRTTVFTASSEVNIGETYHIKLVIADEGDSAFDSGVFLRAGSFDIGEIDLGEDITVEAGTAACDGSPVTIQTTAENVEHVWFKDGFQIDGETTNILEVTEAGNYTVQIIFSPTCILQDDIIVETLPLPEVPSEVNDLFECSASPNAEFNLDDNNPVILGSLNPTDFTINYYETEEDAQNGTNPLPSQYTNLTNPQTVFASVIDNTTNCVATTSFDLVISAPTDAGPATDLVECSATGFASFDLTQNDEAVLNGQIAENFVITYHASQEDADGDVNALTSPYTNTSNPQIIYVRFETVGLDNCYSTTTFNISTEEPTFMANAIEIAECDNDDDGSAEYDLSSNVANVLGDLDASQYLVTFHATQEDADSGANDLASPYTSEPGTIFVRVESVDFVDCFVTETVQLTLNIDPMTSFTEDFDYEVCPDATSPILIEATPDNYELSDVSIRWFRGEETDPIEGETGLTLPVLEGDTYFIEVTFNDTGCVSEQGIEIVTLENCVIPQGISPNNDGLNDTFDLGSFSVSSIEIFNRYGQQIYEKANYVDEWFGQDMDGNELPVGTYFYSIVFLDGERETGWVYIQREN
ncbi:MAG: choice-of-anchor L domain-containing protein [Bacteroidota bacterium]